MNESSRVEAFSDGVFAIAITLLVLEIKVPETEPGESLWSALGHQWPSYAAYVVSFFVIGIMWTNHHQVFGHIARVDRPLLFLNLLLLLVVGALPWPTSLVADYLRDGHNARIAVAIYSGFMVAHALTFSLFWWYVTRTGHLFRPEVDRAAAKATQFRFGLGMILYPVTVGLAFVTPVGTLFLHGALAIYYMFNQLPIPTTDPDRPTATT
ncbi:TMEM175 family protein [Yinghuangia seranimata]|uniref:TMEM175 family protein n=1 Tax=Yinghuangia seranimata TaxID=408067 RepID=UPI00248C171D|nr:TMEM175 family protein [Yinghuangia seranimata]MDI2129795.1 TMEM175 family protein [Yinghuangia seranimata]